MKEGCQYKQISNHSDIHPRIAPMTKLSTLVVKIYFGYSSVAGGDNSLDLLELQISLVCMSVCVCLCTSNVSIEISSNKRKLKLLGSPGKISSLITFSKKKDEIFKNFASHNLKSLNFSF